MWPHSTARSATGMPGRVSTAGAATGTGASFGDRKGLFTHDTPGVPVTHGSIRERSGGRKRNRRAGSVDQARRTCATLGAAPIQSDMYILIRGARRGCNRVWLRAAREPSQGTLLSDSGMAPERSQYSALSPPNEEALFLPGSGRRPLRKRRNSAPGRRCIDTIRPRMAAPATTQGIALDRSSRCRRVLHYKGEHQK